MEKTAFVCDTAYQVFNALNLIWHEKPEYADLYLGEYFKGAGELFERIKKKRLFSHVTLVRPHFRREGEGKLHWYLRHASAYLFPSKTLKRDMITSPTDVHGYRTIYTSTMNCFAICLLAENKDARLYRIDDGAGSYFSYDHQEFGASRLHRIFSRLFHAGTGQHETERLYLYYTQNAKEHTSVEVCAIPRPEDMFLREVRELFQTRDMDERSSFDLLWLTHPDAMEISTEKIDRKVAALLQPYKDRLSVRKHPRDERNELYAGFSLDKNDAMWELLIPFLDCERLTFIGTYSTAQMTPKLLYDLEPAVIILVKLYREVYATHEGLYERIVKASEEFRETYREPEKVIIPENFEEFRTILDEKTRNYSREGRQ